MERYFTGVDAAARQRGFSTCRLGGLVADHHCGGIRDRDCASPESGTLAALTASATKWYRGPGTPEQGARTYYLMNMQEKRAVQRAFPDSIFITFNGSVAQSVPRSSAHLLRVLVAAWNEHQAMVSAGRNGGFRSRHPGLMRVVRSCHANIQAAARRRYRARR
jgi:hypothetical protein